MTILYGTGPLRAVVKAIDFGDQARNLVTIRPFNPPPPTYSAGSGRMGAAESALKEAFPKLFR